MDTYDLRTRTKSFAIDLINFLNRLSNSRTEEVIARQLLRSGTSLAANYRAACRGRSKQEFHAKLSIVVEETDETMFWLEILIETGIADNDFSRQLLGQASEFIRIFSRARKTVSDQLKSL